MDSQPTADYYCACPETLVDTANAGRVRIIPPIEHVCEYVRLRVALIPRAVRMAHLSARRDPAVSDVQHFSDSMNALILSAWQVATNAGHADPGPERNRAFMLALKTMVEEESR